MVSNVHVYVKAVFKAVCVLGFTGLAVAVAWAESKPSVAAVPGPGEVVQQVSDEMMSVIHAQSQLLKDDPDQYFESLETILEKTVHFNYIAKFVMGDYWGGASQAQRSAFAERFKRSMVETIGKGLANYTDLKLVVKPEDVITKKNVAIVKQQVEGGKDPITITYWMGRAKTGEWKLVDVVLDGVKLRETFRSQFASEMSKNNNDVDKVTAGWGVATSS